jgi:hypothetical protein
MNRLATDRRCQVVTALVEGMSINATCRMTGVAKHTVLKLLKDIGCACAAYHNGHVRNLRVRRVQADEIWSFVYGKDKNLTLEQVKSGLGSVWTWKAIDADTGILLFSSLVLMPQFLQTLVGYTSELAGLALSAGGLVLLLEMPIMGQLTTKIQARYLIAFGWLALAVAMFYSTKRIDLQISFSAATWLRIAQVIGLGFLFVPITLVAYIGISPEKNNSVAGIVNFMRNMGSSVGTSLVTTLIARRSQFHQARLVQNVRVDNPNFVNSANGLAQHLATSGVGKHEAQITAYARIYQSLQAQAASMAYVDTFMVLAVGAAIMFFLAFVLKKNDPGAGGVRSGVNNQSDVMEGTRVRDVHDKNHHH